MTKPCWIACLMLSLALASCAILAPSTPAVQSTATRAGATPLASPSAAATATSEPAPVPTNTPISDATEAPATEAPASATPAASPTPLTAFMTFQDFQIVPGTLTIQVGT